MIASLSQQRGEADGSLPVGNASGGWEQPRQSQGGPALPDGPCLVSKTGRCTQGTGVVKPLHRRPARTRWIWAGVRCVLPVVVVSQATRGGGNCQDGCECRAWQVVVNVLRRSHDETAGAKPGASPVDRTTVNVGTIRRSRSLVGIGALPAEGCRWGGVAVVLRGRESRPHGEGRQRKEQEVTVMSEDASVNTGAAAWPSYGRPSWRYGGCSQTALLGGRGQRPSVR